METKIAFAHPMGMHKNLKTSGSRAERILASPQWQNGKFRNPSGAREMVALGETKGVASEFLFGGKKRRPPHAFPTHDPRPSLQQPPETGFRVTWLGHSTLLVEMDGVRFLTDPVWAQRASPVGFVGPSRWQQVPLDIASVPDLDFVLLSHDHYDHLDAGAVTALAKRGFTFLVTLGVGKHLDRWGIPSEQYVELDWWDSVELKGVKVTSTPTQHFSGRGVLDRNSTLWGSFVVEGDTHRFYFGADSGFGDHYQSIAREFGRFDLVTLEIGAFHPSWAGIHMGPENAWRAYDALGGGHFLPIHWGTFDLAVHPWDEPPEQILALAGDRPLMLPQIGSPTEPARWEQNVPWWRP
ncbi:MAG: MBL fold metallo-hydrolase [bacterium]